MSNDVDYVHLAYNH